jgi:hypothetical protein
MHACFSDWTKVESLHGIFFPLQAKSEPHEQLGLIDVPFVAPRSSIARLLTQLLELEIIDSFSKGICPVFFLRGV